MSVIPVLWSNVGKSFTINIIMMVMGRLLQVYKRDFPNITESIFYKQVIGVYVYDQFQTNNLRQKSEQDN